ncbi:hypothetical protein OsI_29055 [Oryza sativa Indica Group]|uniref:F-box domain-containing protein n=1 Tax=Oryza sativa subsp. indica TaxID=39946 RepID=B8BAA7_ORYSI|nr:hypothetical protein OsI_29055 [Oryza sativa Indica Group]
MEEGCRLRQLTERNCTARVHKDVLRNKHQNGGRVSAMAVDGAQLHKDVLRNKEWIRITRKGQSMTYESCRIYTLLPRKRYFFCGSHQQLKPIRFNSAYIIDLLLFFTNSEHFFCLTKAKKQRFELIGIMDELGIIEEGVDWRTRLGQDIRDRVKRDILFSLQMKLQTTTSTTLIDLQKVAARIEERIYKIAIDFGDYLRRISLIKGDLDDSYPLMLNNFLHIHQQASTSSFFLLHQKNKQGQIIQAEGNVQGTSSSSHKEPSHPHGKDRISELPNDLIHHIMSFLSMKEAVRTSVLSHWWVNKWTCLQSIKLDINWFRLDREKFRSSIDKLLLSRDHLDAPMDTFQLDSFAVDRASSWINHAIKHNAKVVKFSEYPSWEPFYLDPELVEFSSRYLKTLELTNAALNEMVFDRLNNACPVLENLVLKECLMEVQHISSSSLQNLDLIGCSLLYNVSICTPSLVSLCIKGQQTGSSSFTNSYLTFTTITLVDASDVTSIELTATDRQFTFMEQQGSRQMFRNLRTLRLGEWCMADNFLPLRQYVNHSPVLRKVFLKLSLVDWWSELTTNQLMALVEISSGGSVSIDFY